MILLKWNDARLALQMGAFLLPVLLAASCSTSNDKLTAKDSASDANDTASDANDTGSTIMDTASATNDTTSDASDTESTIMDTDSEVIDTDSAVRDTESQFNDTGSTLSDSGSSIDDTESVLEDTESSLADTESATEDVTIATMPVNTGEAGNFVILAQSGISNVPTSAVTGYIGISPAAATYITGFALTADSTNESSTSSQVTGMVYASDYAPPTPSILTTAVGDMALAFADAAGRAPNITELGSGNIGGMTIEPGVYKWSTSVLIPTDVTLAGEDTDVWIFQIAGDLVISNSTMVLLNDGAMSKNIFWQVSGLVEVGTMSHVEGVILTKTSVTLKTGASIHGRLLAQTAVHIDSSSVVEPDH